MAVAAVLWDVLSKAANLAQIFGLLVAVGTSLRRAPQSERECARLERCSRRLRALLQWPTGCGAVLLCSEMGGSVTQALVDAAGLVESYKKSTLWHRVRRGKRMAAQLRDMRDVVDSYYGLLLFTNAAHLLLLQHPTPHDPHPLSTSYGSDNPSQSTSAVTSCPTVARTSDAQRANDIVGSQICNTTEPAACERNVPACDSDFPSITVHGGDWTP